MWVVVRQTSYPMASLWSNPDAFGKEVSHKGLIGSTIQNGSIPRLFSNQSRVCHLDSSWIWDLKVTFPSLDSLDVCFKKVMGVHWMLPLLEGFWKRWERSSWTDAQPLYDTARCAPEDMRHLFVVLTLWLPSYLDDCSPQREEMVHTFLTWYWGSLSI